MATTLAELLVRIDTDLSGMERGFTAAQRAANQLGERMQSIGKSLTIGIALPLVAVGAAAAKMASDAGESASKLEAVFGSSAAAMNQWISDIRNTIPATTAQLQDMASGLQALLIPMGVAPAQAGAMTRSMVQLAGDLASFSNIPIGEALQAIQSGLVGETEPLRRFGVVLNEAAIRQEALRQGLVKGKADLTAAAKAQATYAIIMRSTVLAQGDAARTAGSAANSMKFLVANLKETASVLGQQLLPVVTAASQKLTALLVHFRNLDPATTRWALALGVVAAAIPPLIFVAGTLVTSLTAIAAALGTSLLPLIIVGGPIVLALAAVAAGFVKAGLDAAAASAQAVAAAANFRSALGQMNEATLIATAGGRIALQEGIEAALAGLNTQISAAEARARRIRADFNKSPAAFSNRPEPGGLRAADREVARLRAMQTSLNAEYRQAGRELGEIANQYNTIHQAAAATPPIIAPAAATAAKEVADEVDNLAQKLGDMMREAAQAAKEMERLEAVTFKLPPGATEATKLALHAARNESTPNAGSSILGPAANMSRAMALASEAARGFGQVAKDALQQFGPAALAFQAVNAVLQPLQPLLDALLVPLRIFGEIIALSLVPVLKLLFPIIKAVAIVFSYVQEIVDRVLGAILNAVGHFVKGLGKFINAIVPFANPGNPLIKAGEAIINTAHNFTDAAREIAKKREELEKLSFDDALNGAADAANRLSEALVNAAQGFKIERFRFGATSTGSASRAPVPASAASLSISGPVTVVVSGNLGSMTPRELAEKLGQGLKELALSNTNLRPLAAQF